MCGFGAELADAVSGSPLGPVVSAFGVKLTGGDGGVTVAGPLASALRRAAYWYRQPTNDQKLRVGASWVTAGLQGLQRAVPSGSDAGRSSGDKRPQDDGGSSSGSSAKTPTDDMAVAAAAAEGAVPEVSATAVKTSSGRA